MSTSVAPASEMYQNTTFRLPKSIGVRGHSNAVEKHRKQAHGSEEGTCLGTKVEQYTSVLVRGMATGPRARQAGK